MDFFFFFTRLENEEHSFPDYYVPTHINSLSSKLLITTCLKDSLEKGNLNKGTFSITINYRLISEVWDRLVMEGKLRTKNASWVRRQCVREEGERKKILSHLHLVIVFGIFKT